VRGGGRDGIVESMDVYLIPIGRQRYELYCEPAGDPAEPHASAEPPPGGLAGRLRRRFAEVLRAAEERQRNPGRQTDATGSLGRLRERMTAWVAERIAEQRLLWRLRHVAAATAVHPQDMPADEVMAVVQRVLRRDYDRHRLWMVIDAVAFVVSGVLAIVPGPNIVAYYFAFRVWGHWLSMRGATQGLQRVAWTERGCAVLTELREVEVLEPRLRTARVHDIATRLHLPHLAAFFDRLTVRLHHA
jgi:hypothetical protein